MFSIGEFSKISGLSVKALRLYHEQELLVPEVVDENSGYRYYDFKSIERARVITLLRQMMFSLDEIKNILESGGDDSDALSFLENHKARLENKIREMKEAQFSLDRLIQTEKEAKLLLSQNNFQIEEKTLEPQLIAGIRMKGKYSDCSQSFARLGRAMGWNISGKPLNLYFDTEYKEDGADFESCFPIKKQKSAADGISVRKLEGGPAVTLLHKGPYERISNTYAKIFSYINEKGLQAVTPSRESYIKGPGMIFKGRPSAYLTEVQVLVE
jgi:DNA-binding transcriptional MerR regulator/effector-binding domain-containing protein